MRVKQRGGSKINLLLTLLILGSMIFVGVMVAPPYFTNYQLQDAMKTEARFAGYNRKTNDENREDIWKKVKALAVPGKATRLPGTNDNNTVQISIDNTFQVDLKFNQFNLEFHAHGDNHSL